MHSVLCMCHASSSHLVYSRAAVDPPSWEAPPLAYQLPLLARFLVLGADRRRRHGADALQLRAAERRAYAGGVLRPSAVRPRQQRVGCLRVCFNHPALPQAGHGGRANTRPRAPTATAAAAASAPWSLEVAVATAVPAWARRSAAI
eukprot:362616-Chlamydomonas_euryale.AAC.6